MVVAESDGVVNVEPVPTRAPPVAASYQFIVPAEAVAPSVTTPDPQTEPGVVPVIEGIVLIVATTEVLDVVVHVPTVAST